MMNIVAIEFDRAKFDSPISCERWMTANCGLHPEFKQLLDSKKFRLKAGTGQFISDEFRKVWGWYYLWDAKVLKIERPSTDVVMAKKNSTAGFWDHADVPTPLQSTQEKRQRLEFLRQKREFKRRDNAEKLKRKREEKNSMKKKSNSKRAKGGPEDIGMPPTISKRKSRKGMKESDLVTPLTPLGRSTSETPGSEALEMVAIPPSISSAAQALLDRDNILLDETM